jgi:hypothetical protein
MRKPPDDREVMGVAQVLLFMAHTRATERGAYNIKYSIFVRDNRV